MSNASPSLRFVNGDKSNTSGVSSTGVSRGRVVALDRLGLDYRELLDQEQEDEEEEEEEEEEQEEEEHNTISASNRRELRSCGTISIDDSTDYREIVLTTYDSANTEDSSGGGGGGGGGGGTETPGAVSGTAAAAAARAAYNMVAAMNEHLTSSSTSNNSAAARLTTGAILNHEYQSPNDNIKPGPTGILTFPCAFDHMYASMTDGAIPAAANTATSAALGVSPLRGNEPRNNELTEVKHLKELLLLHLDLIQQQSEQIVTKDKLLAALRQENETLKLRLERMDRRVNLQKLRSESTENSVASDHTGPCSPPNLNSVGFVGTSDQQQQHHHHKNTLVESVIAPYNETFKIRLNTSGGVTTVKQESVESSGSKVDLKQESVGDSRLDWEGKKKRRSDPTPLVSSGSKRKRGVSCSSSISNDTTSTIPDGKSSSTHDSSRKADKKAKSLLKKEACLTTEEHYYTAVGDPNYSLNPKLPTPMDDTSSLEVPNWRIKVYTSCYTMEGTENLDDEIFNKRHLKLENDERRRKRWDVQRIREQRHIEKLKQRQERQNHQATCYNTNHTGPCPTTTEEEIITSLWPDIDQIQNLQVDTQLPVSAFGAPIPSFSSSEFSLPWLHTTRSKNRRPKRSTGRRKSRR